MTHAFLTDLEDRKQQVRHYLITVARFERKSKLGVTSRSQEGRLLTLRAGTFLILYNLVEATTRGAIESIHETITTKAVPFTTLSEYLRRMTILLFKREANPAINHSMVDVPTEFVAIALALGQDFKLSGSVDAKAIRELSAKYGFSNTARKGSRGGSDLLIVKRNRNDLAHGIKSFEEIGRDYTASDLILISRRTMHFMTDIMHNVRNYIDNEDYKQKR